MERKYLESLSIYELIENIKRQTLAVEELKYCLNQTLEDQDELIATNQMLHSTAYNLKQVLPSNLKYQISLDKIKNTLNHWIRPKQAGRQELTQTLQDVLEEATPKHSIKVLETNPSFSLSRNESFDRYDSDRSTTVEDNESIIKYEEDETVDKIVITEEIQLPFKARPPHTLSQPKTKRPSLSRSRSVRETRIRIPPRTKNE